MTRSIPHATLGLIVALPCLTPSCDSIATSLGGNVRVIIENNTAFEALPDINTSDSTNFFDDIFTEGDNVTDFGDHGAVPANTTVTFYITCDDSLQHIAIGDVDFRDNHDDQVGSTNANASLRRDSDFDCGDTIRITLSGHEDDFSSDVNVE
ncbi:MAG TPA: hypothetical protein VMV94_20805 [Phycisphaerae bacterium]|nr:hypothetical protein [Phycisphaerae bacterium]